MEKDFDGWNFKKKHLNDAVVVPFYHKREIWWCALGINVGFEQDGTGKNYDRPVLVIRGFNPQVFFGVALTGRKRQSPYHVPIGMVEGREASVILSQARLIDTKRLIRKAGILDTDVFEKVCEELNARSLVQIETKTILPHRRWGEAEAICATSLAHGAF